MLIDRNINNKYLHIPEPIKLLKTEIYQNSPIREKNETPVEIEAYRR